MIIDITVTIAISKVTIYVEKPDKWTQIDFKTGPTTSVKASILGTGDLKM